MFVADEKLMRPPAIVATAATVAVAATTTTKVNKFRYRKKSNDEPNK